MDHTRHIGIFNAKPWSVSLIGAGGIGAMTAIALAKMGVGALDIYDCDTVEDVNLPVQFHKLSDVGKEKAHALVDAIREYADDVNLSSHFMRIDSTSTMKQSPIVISAIDSINGRKDIWEVVKNMSALWYIDARMSAEYFQMYTVKECAKWYEQTLMSQRDEDIPDDPCTSKATIYTGCIAAGHIAAAVRRIVTGHQAPGILTHDILKNVLSVVEM